MSEKYLRQEPPIIGPGLCPPEGCPPPTRIECISVDKVYDSCFQVEERTRVFAVPGFTGVLAVGDLIACGPTPLAPITCREISRTAVGGGFFNIVMAINIPLTLTNPTIPAQTANEIFTVTKTVTLCCPAEATADCSDTNLTSCVCVITNIVDGILSVTCDIQVCVVIKCILTVQLLVPSYGFCTPAPCVALPGVCPPAPPAQCF